MAILRAYFDDSKDNRLLTIAGYLSDIESWTRFEPAWAAVLKKFQVPYLHMKEFWDVEGIYKHIKADPDQEAEFFGDLAQVIKDHLRFCPQTTVLLDDLKRFNSDRKQNLSAPALAIYGVLMRLQNQFKEQSIEIWFDKFERAHSSIELAKHYAEADSHEPLKERLLLATSVSEQESWRTVLPLQAADFIAWEMRKFCSDPIDWISQMRPNDMRHSMGLRSFNEWSAKFQAAQGREPRDRKTFQSLRTSRVRPEGFIFNYAALELLKERHPYGWQLKKSRRLALFSGDQGA